MPKIAKDITELIGNTPIIDLSCLLDEDSLCARLLAKLEFFNPLGSIKDRVALAMIEDAEKNSILKPGSTIIEPTSGNTGIGLAFVGASRGYNVILTMPDTMSVERQRMLTILGAKVILTDGNDGMQASIDKAKQLEKEIENSIILGQFENPANPAIHSKTTAKEIIKDTDGDIDAFVACVGTGGTATGICSVLKEHNQNIFTAAVEPKESPVISGGKAAKHGIQGIGAGFIPANFDPTTIDAVITVSTSDAIERTKQITTTTGVFAGISSGAALDACIQLSKLEKMRDKTIVTIFPDTGQRYLSMFE